MRLDCSFRSVFAVRHLLDRIVHHSPLAEYGGCSHRLRREHLPLRLAQGHKEQQTMLLSEVRRQVPSWTCNRVDATIAQDSPNPVVSGVGHVQGAFRGNHNSIRGIGLDGGPCPIGPSANPPNQQPLIQHHWALSFGLADCFDLRQKRCQNYPQSARWGH